MDVNHEALEIIRRRLEHEDNLVNQRLSWILMSQAFLLTGYAILLNASIDLRSELHARHHALLMWLIPLTGIVTVVADFPELLAVNLPERHLCPSPRLGLAAGLSHSGSGHLQTGARGTFEKIGGAFAIPQIELETWAAIPDMAVVNQL